MSNDKQCEKHCRRKTKGCLLYTSSYAEGSPDTPQALINSNGYVEVFLKEGRAADRLKVDRGQRIELC